MLLSTEDFYRLSHFPTDLAFWLFIPGLLLILVFGWLVYTFRGSRRTVFSLSGLGLSVIIDSQPKNFNEIDKEEK